MAKNTLIACMQINFSQKYTQRIKQIFYLLYAVSYSIWKYIDRNKSQTVSV